MATTRKGLEEIVIQNGNNTKRTRRDRDRRVIILPPTTAEEHIAVQRESKARTTLLQSIPDDHVADFHYMDDTRDIWNAVKARFGRNVESKKMRKFMLKQEFSEFRIGVAEGLHKGYDRMQKILSQLNQLKAKPEDEDINLKFLRALPSSWSQVALTLKTKGRLKLLSFDDLYYKLKTLEVDVKGYTTFSSSQSGPSHYAFISATSASKKMSYGDSLSYSSSTTYSAPSNSKTGSHRSDNVIKDVLQSFVADTEPEQQLAYEDFEQIEKLDLEEMDLKWKMAMLSVRCYKCQQSGHFARECRAKGGNDKQRYSSLEIKEIGKKEKDSKALITVDTLVDWTYHDGKSDGVIASKEFGMIDGCDTEDVIEEGAAKTYNLITGADTEEASTAGDAGEFALMGVTSERNSSKNLFRLIDSFMSVRTKVGLGFNNCIRENELGWDNSAFSVFITTSEDVEGRPIFHRFAKADSMKAVPPPLSGDYISLSDHIDLDESQMSYGTKSSTSCDSKFVSNDFVSCDDSDKSSEVNTNDFATSDSSVKSSEPKPNDTTSCASTSSDLPSFSCNSSDKNENISRISCNKNGYFNKKTGHFRKHASYVSKLCFEYGSGTHLIKDCDFYEKQMANKTVGIGVGPEHCRDTVNHQNQFVPQVVLLRTGKVIIPPTRPQPVPTGKPKVFALVPAGRQNRPFPENPFLATEDEGIFDSGCSRSMTSNKERLDDFQEFQGRKVTFGGGEGRITGKGTIRTPTLDFKNVHYVKELQQFNLFSISQICDKKNRVLFTDTECLVLSKDFKLPDQSMVVLRVPRKHNLYTINLHNLYPMGNLACLVAHASVDESVKWHTRMGHVNYKNMNRLAKGNLVRGLPLKLFKNDHTCVACCKGKQHKDELVKDEDKIVVSQR
nr:ribonuclease H-like domain-containing protein [Tanacetum cinerariifolium]